MEGLVLMNEHIDYMPGSLGIAGGGPDLHTQEPTDLIIDILGHTNLDLFELGSVGVSGIDFGGGDWGGMGAAGGSGRLASGHDSSGQQQGLHAVPGVPSPPFSSPADSSGHGGSHGMGSRMPSEGSLPPGSKQQLAQLAALQAQLQSLQSMISMHMQSLQQASGPDDGAGNGGEGEAAGPEIGEMQRMLTHMQGLLLMSQQQSQQQQSHLQPPTAAAAAAQQQQQQQQQQPLSAAFVKAEEDAGVALAGVNPLMAGAVAGGRHRTSSGGNSVATVVASPVVAAARPQLQKQQPAPQPRQAKEPTKRHKVHRNPVVELEKQLEAKQAEANALLQKNEALKRRQRMLGHFIQVRETQMQRLGVMKARPQAVQNELGHYLSSNTKTPLFKPLTVESIQTMDADTSAALYGEIVAELSRLLAMSSQEPESLALLSRRTPLAELKREDAAAGGRKCLYLQLEDMIRELQELPRYAALLNPNFHVLRYDNGPTVQGAAPPEHWAHVVDACALEEDQMQDLAILADIHASLTARVYKERAQLASALQETLTVEPLSGWGGSKHMRMLGTAARSKGAQLSEKLHRNLLQERCVVYLTSDVMYQHILSVEQLAHLTVASYPHKPDEQAIWTEACRIWRQHGGGACC